VQASQVRLFPLPGLVLFPRTLLPLHIFEPRYIRMVRDALAGDRRIATACLRRGWQRNYYGEPPFHRVITVARILNDEKLPGGRYNLIIEGIERAEALEEVSARPYRVVKARSLVELLGPEERELVNEARRDMVSLAGEIAREQPEFEDLLANLENAHLHPGIIADQIASLLVREAYERQSLLEERRVLRRMLLVNVCMRRHLAELRNAATEPEEA